MDVSKEPIEVQAAYEWLKDKHVALYLDWFIANDNRRLAAARKCAEIHRGIEHKLTSNRFKPYAETSGNSKETTGQISDTEAG